MARKCVLCERDSLEGVLQSYTRPQKYYCMSCYKKLKRKKANTLFKKILEFFLKYWPKKY